MKKSLSVNQICCIILVAIMSNKFLVLPSLLYNRSGNDALIVTILMYTISTLIVAIFIKCAKIFPNMTFKQIIEQKLGKFAFKVICVLFLALFFVKTTLLLCEGEFFLQDSLYSDFDTLLYAVPMFLVSGYIAYKGLRVIGRTFETFNKLIIAGLILTFTLATVNINIDGVLPLFTHSLGNITSTCIASSLWFGNYFFLFMCLGHIKMEKNFSKRVMSSMIFGCLAIVVFYYLYIALFEHSSSIHQLAIGEITEITPNFEMLTKVDWFTVLIWSIIMILQISIQFIITITLFVEATPVKKNVTSMYVTFGILFLVYYLQPFSYEQVLRFSMLYFSHYSFVINIGLSILLFLLAVFHKKQKREKGVNYAKTLAKE